MHLEGRLLPLRPERVAEGGEADEAAVCRDERAANEAARRGEDGGLGVAVAVPLAQGEAARPRLARGVEQVAGAAFIDVLDGGGVHPHHLLHRLGVLGVAVERTDLFVAPRSPPSARTPRRAPLP